MIRSTSLPPSLLPPSPPAALPPAPRQRHFSPSSKLQLYISLIAPTSRSCFKYCGQHKESAREIQAAVDMLKSLEWEEIRKEKFSITPIAIFESFVRLAESMISREAAEKQRRQQWLAEANEEAPEQDTSAIPLSTNTADKYGVDLEEFKLKTGKKPLHWQSSDFVVAFVCVFLCKRIHLSISVHILCAVVDAVNTNLIVGTSTDTTSTEMSPHPLPLYA